MILRHWRQLAIAAGVVFAAGLLVGWWLFRPDAPVRETAAPAITLPSGAIVAARIPDAPLPPVAREAARELRGETVRAGTVVVQPDSLVSASLDTGSPDKPCTCAPVKLDWSLTRLDDGSSRMSFWTGDGRITEAIDIPFVSIRGKRQPRWSALAFYGPDGYGGGATRRLGRLPVEVGAVGLKVRGEVVGMAVAKFSW